MKRVLLLGDSIRMGYDEMVRELLKDECEVLFAEEDNGRFAAYTLWQANQFFKEYGHFDLVHWNNGYWDLHAEAPMTEAMHPLNEYENYLKRIIRLIRQNGAQIVFATTTPFYEPEEGQEPAGGGETFYYHNDQVVKYNEAACRIMEAEGIPVNDLYALCLKGPRYYKCEDMLHLKQEGYQVVARQTAECIRKLL